MIGIGLAGVLAVPGLPALVMATYLSGLALVVNGWVERGVAALSPAALLSTHECTAIGSSAVREVTAVGRSEA